MNYRMLFRMAKWAHTPPSTKRVVLVMSILAACLVLYGVERFIGLPEWTQMEPTRDKRLPTHQDLQN
ncbi:MAG: hypothetical protein AAF280_05740 [Pseudomonadota bacterium]